MGFHDMTGQARNETVEFPSLFPGDFHCFTDVGDGAFNLGFESFAIRTGAREFTNPLNVSQQFIYSEKTKVFFPGSIQ